MAMPTPQAAAARWRQNLAGSTDKLMAGVMAVQTAPTAQAAQAVDRMVAGIQRAAAEGRIQDGLNSVSLSDWQQAMKTKTVPRVQSGATAGEPKMVQFMTQFLPFEQQVVQSLPARGSLEENINRATQLMRANSQFRFNKRAR